MCENLIDYQEKTSNPSIRDDFISTRLYGMTFAPNKTDSVPSLPNPTDLKYMPTYEQSKIDDVIQIFISEDFLNSITNSYATDNQLNVTLMENGSELVGYSCAAGTWAFFDKSSSIRDCRLNLTLVSLGNLQITAGQLFQENATFILKFFNPITGYTLANLHISFTIWLSFNIQNRFQVANIDIGYPKKDYNITAWVSDSTIGNLRSNTIVQEIFTTAMKALLKPDYTFSIYDNLFKYQSKLKYLRP